MTGPAKQIWRPPRRLPEIPVIAASGYSDAGPRRQDSCQKPSSWGQKTTSKSDQRPGRPLVTWMVRFDLATPGCLWVSDLSLGQSRNTNNARPLGVKNDTRPPKTSASTGGRCEPPHLRWPCCLRPPFRRLHTCCSRIIRR